MRGTFRKQVKPVLYKYENDIIGKGRIDRATKLQEGFWLFRNKEEELTEYGIYINGLKCGIWVSFDYQKKVLYSENYDYGKMPIIVTRIGNGDFRLFRLMQANIESQLMRTKYVRKTYPEVPLPVQMLQWQNNI